MIKRRHLVQLLAVAPVAAALPAATAIPPGELYTASYSPEALAAMKLPEPTLHIWRSETDFVIAASAEEAAHICCQHNGWEMSTDPSFWSETDGAKAEHWEQWPEDKVFPLTEEVDEAEAKAAYEKAQEAMRDFIASENRANMLWTPRMKQDDFPALRDAWVFDDEPQVEPERRPRVTWHIQRRNSKENPEAKNLIWGKTTRMLPAEWVKQGRGYLGSTEW